MLVITFRIVIHGLLFLAAAAVFFLGLGVGLQYSPPLGTALWVSAALIVVLNLAWVFRGRAIPDR